MDDAQKQFKDDYNNLGIKTNASVPLDQSPVANNAGVKDVVGNSDKQTTQEPVSPSGVIRNSTKTGYNIGTGWWIGIDSDGIAKFFIGKDSGNKLTWDGTTLSITGSISATSGTIGGFTIGATDLSATSGGNTTKLSSGATAFSSGPTGAPTTTITQSGFISTIGLTSLNMKSFTNFETATRFTQVVDGAGAVTFNTSGLRLETSTTATSSCINKWFASQNVFNNSPTFSCSIEWGSIPTNAGVGFIGLGSPATFTGSGATFTGSHIGFEFQFQSSVWNMYGSFNNGGTEQFTLLTTVASSDVMDLILKVNGTTSVDFYYRKNSGSMVKTTLTATVPSSVNNNIWFAMSNKGDTNNIVCLVYNAGLER